MKTKEIRSRSLTIDSVEANKIQGYAVVFNEPSEDLGGFIERIAPQAFEGVSMDQVLCLYNHDTANILARSDSGNLNLRVDPKGLYFEASLPETTLARDVFANIQAGNVKGCSFGFTVANDEWELSPDSKEPSQRLITQIDQLFEITLTPIPAYQDTSVSQRSLETEQNRFKNQLKLIEYYKETI